MTLLDPGFHEMKQEEFDGNKKDRIKSMYVTKRHLKIGTPSGPWWFWMCNQWIQYMDFVPELGWQFWSLNL